MNTMRLVIVGCGLVLIVGLVVRLVQAVRGKTVVGWDEALLLGLSYSGFVLLAVARSWEQRMVAATSWVLWAVIICLAAGLAAVLVQRRK